MTKRKLASREQKVFNDSVALFEKLIDDLASKELLRKGIPRNEREKLAALWRNSRHMGQAFNVIFSLFDSKETIDSFVKKNREEGITHDVLTYTFATQLFGIAILNFESIFKTSLLFFLKEDAGFDRRMTLGAMIKTLKTVSPLGAKVENIIDFRLRNSLAHGTFWFGKGSAFLAENSYIENVQPIPLASFMTRIKIQNIVAHALIEVLLNKKNQGYFD